MATADSVSSSNISQNKQCSLISFCMETNKVIVIPTTLYLMTCIKIFTSLYLRRHIHKQIHKIKSINMKKYSSAHQWIKVNVFTIFPAAL